MSRDNMGHRRRRSSSAVVSLRASTPDPVSPLRLVSNGIPRKPPNARRPSRPLTERHLAVLAVLTQEPQPDRVVAQRLGLSRVQAQSALNVLAVRSLAMRKPNGSGWVKLDEAPVDR